MGSALEPAGALAPAPPAERRAPGLPAPALPAAAPVSAVVGPVPAPPLAGHGPVAATGGRPPVPGTEGLGGSINARSWVTQRRPRSLLHRRPDDAAVFVDASGARSRWLRPVGRALAAACGAYLVATTLSVLGAPWVPHLSLPALGPVVPAAHPLHRPALPANALATPLPGPAPSGPSAALPKRTAPAVPGAPVASAPSARGAAPTTPHPVTTSPVSAAPSTTVAPGHGRGPTTTTAPTGPTTTPTTSPPTSAPGHSGSSPGKTRHGG